MDIRVEHVSPGGQLWKVAARRVGCCTDTVHVYLLNVCCKPWTNIKYFEVLVYGHFCSDNVWVEETANKYILVCVVHFFPKPFFGRAQRFLYEYCLLDHIPALEFLPAVLLPTTRREPQDDKWQEREFSWNGQVLQFSKVIEARITG